VCGRTKNCVFAPEFQQINSECRLEETDGILAQKLGKQANDSEIINWIPVLFCRQNSQYMPFDAK